MADSRNDAGADVEAFASAQEGYITNYIQLADGKALGAFAWASATAAFLFNQSAFLDVLRTPALTADWVFAALSSLALIASAGASTMVVAPRLWSSGRGLIFWAAISEHVTEDSYIQSIEASSREALARARLRNTFHLAKICTRKYRLLRIAIWAAALGFAFSALWFLGGP